MEMRVREVGKSECRSVIGRIGVEGSPDITSPERAQTSDRSLFA